MATGIGTRTPNARTTGARHGISRLRRAASVALACLFPVMGVLPTAHAQSITASNGLSCMADRMDNPSNLACTANDFSHIVTAEAINAPGVCTAGSELTVTVQLTLQSNATDRYDIGLFMGEGGNDPATLGGTCSVATFAESPLPFADLDAATQPTDTCGDFKANGSATVTIQNVKLTCTAGADGKLVMPYTLAYSQNTGDVCTSPGVVRAGTTSKCSGGTASVANIGVAGEVKVTKQTLPDGAAASFAFTAADGANTSPTSFSLVDGGSQVVTTTFGATGSSVTIDEAVPAHWRSTVACASGNVDTSGQANGTFVANLTSAAPTADCTVTNTQRARITLAKSVVGGRNNAADQFMVSATGGGTLTNAADVTIAAPVTATTTGTGTTAAVMFYSTPGTALLLADAMAAGSVSTLADYSPTYSCTNATAASATVMPSGSGAGFALTPAPGDDITCTFTNTLITRPTLALDKRLVSGAGFDGVGDVIQYAYDVTNTGNVTITGPITVSDDKIASVSCPAGDLAPGAMLTCTASYTVTQADLNAGSVTNIATAAGSFNNQPVTSNQDTVTVEALQEPALAIDKRVVSGNPYDSVGDVIQYAYDVTNTGNVTISDPITVSDDRIASVTCPALPAGGLAPGAMLTCTASYTVTQADLNAGSVTNVASATSGTTQSPTDTATVNAAQAPALGLEKTASPLVYDAAGDVISYNYALTNTGNVTLSAPYTVTDDKTAVTCPATPSTLAPGQTVTCTATYTITQADVNAGSVTNLATASATFNAAPVNSAQDSATVTATQTPALAIDKRVVSGNPYDSVGDVIQYAYDVTNTGNVTISDPITVSDDRIASVTCPALPAGGLAPGAMLTCTASYTVTQADLNAGSVTNVASATSGTTQSPTDTATVNAAQAPALGLEKTASPLVYDAAGDVISYNYALTNTGNVTLSAPYAVTDDKTAVTCPATPSTLAPGHTVTCTATYTITQADVNAGSVTNLATASATFNAAPVNSPQDSATVTATQAPALALDKRLASGAGFDGVGDVIQYAYDVTNTGNVTITGPITVSDDKIASVSCPAGDLAPGAMITCTASYTVTQADLNAGSVTNIATAAGSFNNQPVTSNQDTVTVGGAQTPVLGLEKTASPLVYDAAGDVISYNYALTNTGNVTLSPPYAVTDDKTAVTCPATPSTLAPGQTVTCTATYTITQADVNAGSVTNLATASATFNAAPVNSAQDSATVTATQAPALALDKRLVSGAGFDGVGDVIQYAYDVTNTGNVTITGPITVSDDKIASVSCPAGDLAPGAMLTCTASYTVTQADLNAGSVTNIATAAGSFNNQPVTSNQDTVTAEALQEPALAIDKRVVSGNPYDSVGDVIQYAYDVTNTGNVTINDPITVSDDRIASVTCPALPAGGLAPGAMLTCTASYTVTQADLNAGSVTNVASATSGTTQSPTDTATVNAAQAPALGLEKTASPLVYDAAGDVISYSYLLTNTGNVTLSAPYAVTDDKTAVTCPATPSTLAPGQTVTCTATYTITQADVNAGSVTNLATASATFNAAPVNSAQDSATVTATQAPALALDKRLVSGAGFDGVGDVIQYAYDVTNTGNVTVTGPITVSDDKIASVSCPAGDLAPGAMITCTASYTVTQADVNAGSVTNIATAAGSFDNQPVTSNQDTVTVEALQEPALAIDKRVVSGNPYDSVGNVIQYAYDVTNTGNVTITDPITVSDDRIASVTCPALPAGGLAPGAMLTCTASYTVTQADLNAGSVTNVASATSGTTQSPPDTETANATQRPALSLDKRLVSGTTITAVGNLIQYAYDVRNTGNVTVAGPITVSDDKIASVSCPAGDLAPGAMITCTAAYSVTQADLDAGSVTNIATASGTFNGQAVTSNQDTVTVEALHEMAVVLTKVAATREVRVGDLVRYTVVARNVGPGPVVDATLIDIPPRGFTYVEGSLTANDGDNSVVVTGVDPVRISGVDIATNGTATFVYFLRVGAGAGRGTHINRVVAVDPSEHSISNEATAEVVISGDPLLEDSLIVGTVFDDLNADGMQQPGERGIPGVRIGSVEGLVMETDAFGRYHLVGIEGGDFSRGRNFILKVDASTLPAGTTFTTENPRVRRITPGVPVRFDFGVKLPNGEIKGGHEELDAELGEVLFDPRSSTVKPEFLPVIDKVADKVREYNGGRIVITAKAEEEALAYARARAVHDALKAKLDPALAERVVVDVVADTSGTMVRLNHGIHLGAFLFDTDKSVIKPQYRGLIKEIADDLNRMGRGTIGLVGHADMRASNEYNRYLGLRRSKAVFDAILAQLSPEVRQRVRVDISDEIDAGTGVGDR